MKTILWTNPLNKRSEFVTREQAQGTFYLEGTADSLLAIGDEVMDESSNVFGFIACFYSEDSCLVIGDDGKDWVISPRHLSKTR